MAKYKLLIRMLLVQMKCGRSSKKQKHCLPEELAIGDCWIALSLAQLSGLILTGRVGKHTDELVAELLVNTQGKLAVLSGTRMVGEDMSQCCQTTR